MHIHISNQFERLVDALARVVDETPLSSPFARETMLVPSTALGAWLSLELAKRHGIFANPAFVTPRVWLEDLTQHRDTNIDADDPFRPGPLAWSIAATLPAHLANPVFAELQRYLADDTDGTKRLALATRIACVFDAYVLHRPDMVLAWESGANAQWQAVLFRALVARHGSVHLAARVHRGLAAIPEDRLPDRLVLFALGALPPIARPIVDALGARIPVHSFVLDTSRLHVDPGETSLLAALQHDRPAGQSHASVRPLPADRSLSVHSCHSPMRECEVLRDQLLAALAEDPTLQPRDVLVLCPDLDGYAPVIDAVFDVDRKDPRHLPFRVVDGHASAALPVAEALLSILTVVSSRMTAPEVVDVLAREPVRMQFGISEADLERVRGWIRETGIRWAVDEEHRREVGQPALRDNTWRFGLDRLLLGYAMGKDGDALFEGVLPYDDVEGTECATLGGLSAFCEALFAARRELAGVAAIPAWRRRIARVLETLIASHWTTEYQHQIVREALEALVRRAGAAGFTEPVPLAVVRDTLAEDLTERSGHVSLSSGPIPFASLAAGRCVPARIVALLGMNDGIFPRRPRPMGFDLMAAKPLPGDPSPRDEGRRLFDEAVISARDRLIITYGGRSIRNDAERPPSVVVSELLEQVEAVSGADVRQRVVVQHALHAFSPRYFRGEDERLFSHDAALCDAARALQGPRQEPPAFVRASLPEPDEALATRVSLDELCAYFASPTAVFVSRRVGVRLGEDVEPLADREPLALGGLDRFAVETEILERARTRKRVSVMPAAIAASGQMPLGTIGAVTYDDIHAQPAQMGVLVRETLGTRPPPPHDIDIVIADGARLVGWLRSIGEKGQIIYRYARPRAKHHLDAWIRHLAMLASGVKLETHVFARGEDAPTRFRYLDVPDPVALLADLVGLYRLGQRVPLPLFPAASMAYAEARRAGKEPDIALRAAQRVFADDFDGARADYVKKVYAEHDPLDPAFRLVEDAHVPSFDVLAQRVFSPLLLHRTEVS